MAADSQWPLQVAIYDALRADAALKALISDPVPVYDHVPQDTSPPYIVIGESLGAGFDTKTSDGFEQTVMIHTWSEHRGTKEAKEVMAAINDALDQVALTVTGHALPLLRFEFSDTMMDPDGITRHGVQRFRAITEAA